MKQPLYYNRKMIILGEAMVFNETGKAVVFQNKIVYYQITSKISYGKKLWFSGAYDISEVYVTRHQQLVSFRKIFVLVIGIEISILFSGNDPYKTITEIVAGFEADCRR